jgi:hypothetical protein
MAKGLSKITKPLALKLLSACDGDEIWSCQHCRSERVPEDWIARLRDVFESDFSEQGSTIFEEGKRVSQYEGVRSVDIAVAVAMSLGIQIDPWVLSQNHRAAIVAAPDDTVGCERIRAIAPVAVDGRRREGRAAARMREQSREQMRAGRRQAGTRRMR